MFYIIGGAPRLGKSIAAQRLMTQTKTPWLSTDVLRTVFSDIVSPSERNKMFPFADEMGDKKWFEKSPEEISNMQLQEAHAMMPGLNSFIQHQIIVKDNFILEGVHLLPEQIHELMNKPELKDNLRVVFVVALDLEVVKQGLSANTSHFNWLADASEEVLDVVSKFVVDFSTRIKTEAQKYNLPVIERSSDFEKDMDLIVKSLL